jgi:23S rRNA pseudouridine1911/1915/1917 synthase
MMEEKHHIAVIPEEHAGSRLDRCLAQLFPDYSRAKIQTWISKQQVQVDGEYQPRRYTVKGGEQVELRIQHEVIDIQSQPENIKLNIVYEDDHLLVIDKPVGMVVHPGAGNHSGTLLNALLFYGEQQAGLPRAGIVHRLDKDTSGLMVVAKSLEAHSSLVESFQEHTIDRRYYAIVRGQLISGGMVNEPIGRHPTDRIKMAVNIKGKDARTHYKVVEKFQRHTWVEAKLETGRTHQIRVHFAYKNMPLVGDSVYTPRIQRVANVPTELNEAVCAFPRQALHSYHLAFQHPVSGEDLQWISELPEDMQQLLETLRTHSPL